MLCDQPDLLPVFLASRLLADAVSIDVLTTSSSSIFTSQIAKALWWYYFSKFIEFFDTVSVVAIMLVP